LVTVVEIYSTAAQLKRFFPYTNGHEVKHGNTVGQEPETKFDVTKISLKPVAKS
jgi:BarA-like signal transduction histidine kinase